jgi:hypothetical protein
MVPFPGLIGMHQNLSPPPPNTQIDQTSNPPDEFFYKPPNADWTDPQYYDVLSDTVWLTRQNGGGPVYNYKYYLDTYGRDATGLELVREST